MKFAKILQTELVPEWRKKYIDYKPMFELSLIDDTILPKKRF